MRKWIVTIIAALALLFPALARADCSPQTIQIVTALGAAAGAVSATAPAIAGKTWVLQDFLVDCGQATAAGNGTITVTGLQGQGATTVSYPFSELTTLPAIITDNYHGTPGLSGGAITVSVPAVVSGGACSVVMRICR